MNLLVSVADPLLVNIAHGESNYLVSFSVPVTGAWTIEDPVAYLYLDVGKTTGAITYGYNTEPPIMQSALPHSSLAYNGRTWFNTTTFKSFEGINGTWREVIRIFIAKVSGNDFSSMSDSANTNNFSGSQIGQFGNTAVEIGRIVLDGTGAPIRRPNGEFFTTVTKSIVDGTDVMTVQLDSTVLPVIAEENIAAYTVLRVQSNWTAVPAKPADVGHNLLVIAQHSATVGQSVNTTIQGIITNSAWTWTTVGSPVWIDVNGTLTLQKPTDPTHSNYAPVGKVVDRNRILFNQGDIQVISVNDGSEGGVQTVNHIGPDSTGNITIGITDIPTLSTKIQQIETKTTTLENKVNVLEQANFVKTVNGKAANATGNVVIEVPTKVSDLTNDLNFITAADIPPAPNVPTKVSAFENDAGYITEADIPDVTVPTKTSDLTNDSGFITAADIPPAPNVPTKTSDLTNDSGFITEADIPDVTVPTKVSAFENDAGYLTEADIPDVGGGRVNVVHTAVDSATVLTDAMHGQFIVKSGGTIKVEDDITVGWRVDVVNTGASSVAIIDSVLLNNPVVIQAQGAASFVCVNPGIAVVIGG